MRTSWALAAAAALSLLPAVSYAQAPAPAVGPSVWSNDHARLTIQSVDGDGRITGTYENLGSSFSCAGIVYPVTGWLDGDRITYTALRRDRRNCTPMETWIGSDSAATSSASTSWRSAGGDPRSWSCRAATPIAGSDRLGCDKHIGADLWQDWERGAREQRGRASFGGKQTWFNSCTAVQHVSPAPSSSRARAFRHMPRAGTCTRATPAWCCPTTRIRPSLRTLSS